MKKYSLAALFRLSVCMGVVLLGSSLSADPSFSQDDMTHIKAEAFGAHSRQAAVFLHDAHNEKAKIDECATCHHGKDAEGKQDKDDMTAGTPCAECHASVAATGTPLMRAYHQQCISCHEKEDNGPTHCAGCHKKE